MGEAVTVISQLCVRPEAQAEFEALCREQRSQALANEPGCLAYLVSRAVQGPLAYVVLEQFADRIALKAHMAAPYVERVRTRLPSLLSAPASIQIYADLS